MGFLPKDYEVPKDSSNYFKFKQGANKFRILDNPILGQEGWTNENKPLRARMEEPLDTTNLKAAKSGKLIKHFWAMPVYNYDEKKIQVLEITQVSIQEIIKEYTDNPDWGEPLQYDITVTRKGENLDTEYTVIASPKKEIAEEIKKEWETIKNKGFNIDNMFTNENPFAEGEQEINVKNIPF